MFAANDDILTT